MDQKPLIHTKIYWNFIMLMTLNSWRCLHEGEGGGRNGGGGGLPKQTIGIDYNDVWSNKSSLPHIKKITFMFYTICRFDGVSLCLSHFFLLLLDFVNYITTDERFHIAAMTLTTTAAILKVSWKQFQLDARFILHTWYDTWRTINFVLIFIFGVCFLFSFMSIWTRILTLFTHTHIFICNMLSTYNL